MRLFSKLQWKDFTGTWLVILAIYLGTVLAAGPETTTSVNIDEGNTTSNEITTTSMLETSTSQNISTQEPTTNGSLTETPNESSTSATTSAGTTASATDTTLTVLQSTSVKATTPAPCPPVGQRFDAASFVGGIVLCGGIVAIVLLGCKYYKSKSERNYHQF